MPAPVTADEGTYVAFEPRDPNAPKPTRQTARRGLFARAIDWLDQGTPARRVPALAILVAHCVLICAAVVCFTFDAVTLYLDARRSASLLGKMVAESVRNPLMTGQAAAAGGALNAFAAHPQFQSAAAYKHDGRHLSRTSKDSETLPMQINADTAAGTDFGLFRVRHTEVLTQDGGRLGFAITEAGLGGMYLRLAERLVLLALGLGAACFCVRWLARRFSPPVLLPFNELGAVAVWAKDPEVEAGKPSDYVDPDVSGIAKAIHGLRGEIHKREEKIEQLQLEFKSDVEERTREFEQQIAERQLAEEAMKESEQRYRALFENNPVPMFVMDLETLKFVAVNHAAVKHYGYTQAEFMKMTLTSLTHGADPIEVSRAFRSEAKSFDVGEWHHRRKNNEIIDVALTAHAIVFAGKVTKIVLATDVTERNRTQRQLQEMHKKLMETSRQAGMAEVATGVLHNVGNVLNSVNVSASLLGDNVRHTKAVGVKKVADLIAANASDLAAFFGPDGKGQMLPGYLASLAEQLAAEQAASFSELDQLQKNIAHIKDIVAMQQSHARVVGVLEGIPADSLIEDALRLVDADLKSSGVRVEVNAEPGMPELHTDRHKVTQILVNLITNARQAMDNTDADDRILTINISRDGTHGYIVMQDRGCGIPRENLTRIFNHGFTTKPEGHGFGLHGAANAAKEVGGALTGASDGPGTGATFTLKLPVASAEEPAVSEASSKAA
jgi:PAS domain S-box-containing protein